MRFSVAEALVAAGPVVRLVKVDLSDETSGCVAVPAGHAQSPQVLPDFAGDVEGLAAVFSDLTEAERAIRLLAMGDALRVSRDQMRLPSDQREFERRLARLHAQLPDAVFDLAWNAGHTASLLEIVREISQI